VRELAFLGTAEVTLLGERRRVRPYGLAGGAPGVAGRDWLFHRRRRVRLPGKATLRVERGDRLRIETPGGGGFGPTRPPARRLRRLGAERRGRAGARDRRAGASDRRRPARWRARRETRPVRRGQ